MYFIKITMTVSTDVLQKSQKACCSRIRRNTGDLDWMSFGRHGGCGLIYIGIWNGEIEEGRECDASWAFIIHNEVSGRIWKSCRFG